MSTTAQIYDKYHVRLWREWLVRREARLMRAYPETGGVELYVHNWHVCGGTAAGREPGASERAQSILDAEWATWRRISDRGDREYARAQHAEHIREKRVGAYLWCDACQQKAA